MYLIHWSYLTLFLKVAFVVSDECIFLKNTPAACATYWGRSSTPPLVVLSFDGFRADYIEKHPELVPRLRQIRNCGARVPFMQPSFPTKTFPNHYAMATGMYPESHGVVNNFFDPILKRPFSLRRNANEGWLWYGEPIWNTVVRAGKKSATIFWPGSGAPIGAFNATYNLKFNPSLTMEDRMQQIIRWLQMPVDQRPQLIAAYFEEPDGTSHETGAGTPQVWTQVSRVDKLLGTFIDGATSVIGCVNLMVVADHGMVTIEVGEKLIKAQDYFPNFGDKYYATYGPIGYITPIQEGVGDEAALDILGCQVSQMRFMPKDLLPERMHHSRSNRIAPFLGEIDLGYRFVLSGEIYSHPGQHGWDNLYPEMQATFSAVGPSFKRNIVAASFENVQLYNLMCEVLKISPAPSNGTYGALNYLVEDPAPLIPLAAKTSQITVTPRDASPPVNWEVYLRSYKFCKNPDQRRAYRLLQKYEFQALPLGDPNFHEPWGRPVVKDAACSRQLTLLYITLYSSIINRVNGGVMLSSFTIGGFGSQNNLRDFPDDFWFPNFQLLSLDNGKSLCEDWAPGVDLKQYKLYPTFPLEFAQGDEVWLINNAMVLPRDQYLLDVLQLLYTKIGAIATLERPVNVLGGIAITPDPFTCERNAPKKLGYVVTQCKVAMKNITNCPLSQLDAQAFILPTHLSKSNRCIAAEDFLKYHVATVRDVELASGFAFFPNLPTGDRAEFVTRLIANSKLVVDPYPSWFAK